MTSKIYCGRCNKRTIDDEHFDTNDGLCSKCLHELESNIIKEFSEETTDE